MSKKSRVKNVSRKIRISNRTKDPLTPEARSQLMAKIKSKGTKPEVAMAKILRKMKLKFRRHRNNLPGTPDFILIEYQTALFVDGDFWHGRNFKKWENRLLPYWRKKIGTNIKRDRKNFRLLQKLGWHVIRIWESDMKSNIQKCELKLESVRK